MGYKGLPQSVEWWGHYERPYGKTSVFHVDSQEQINVVQQDEYSRILCRAEMSPEMQDLAWAVNGCKLKFAGRAGGSFVINEFGWVIVPLVGHFPRVIGRWRGDMYFRDFDNNLFSMASPVTGSWPYPYLGIKFHLSGNDRIYLKYNNQAGEEIFIYSPYQDSDLIKRLRRIRPGHSGISFLVNCHGVVLVKSNNGYGPVYSAGKIDFYSWFPDAMDFEDGSDEAGDMLEDLEAKMNSLNRESREKFHYFEYYYINQGNFLDRWQTWQLSILYNSVD